MRKIFWRVKDTKEWFTGWIVEKQGSKIKINSFNGIIGGRWFDKQDIEYEVRL